MTFSDEVINESSIISAWVNALDRGSLDELLSVSKIWTSVHTKLLRSELTAQYSRKSTVGSTILSCTEENLLLALSKISNEESSLDGAIPVVAGLSLLDGTL